MACDGAFSFGLGDTRKSRKHKRPVGRSWRMDEPYIKVKGGWKYLYRTVDKEGQTVDFLLRAHRG